MRNIIVLLVLSCSALYAKETATYDMILWGDKVGKMLVTHDVAADVPKPITWKPTAVQRCCGLTRM